MRNAPIRPVATVLLSAVPLVMATAGIVTLVAALSATTIAASDPPANATKGVVVEPVAAQGAVDPAADADVDVNPGWIVGTWERDTRRGTVRETWRRVSDRTLEGDGRFVSDEDGSERSIESLLLADMGGAWFYLPKVDENELPVAFRRTEATLGRMVFENPAHDFPQTIVYERDGDDGLLVTISGPDGSGGTRSVEFRFRRAAGP